MRLAAPLALLAAIGAASACAGDAVAPRAPAPRPAGEAASSPPEPAAAWVLADLERLSPHSAVAIDSETFGATLGTARVVVQGATVRVAPETVHAFLERVERAPGGGFLFFAHGSIYASDSFDGPLRPVVALPDNVSRVWFGPKGMLVRSVVGERWYLSMPGGSPISGLPLGLVEIASLSDGRVAALADVGRALVSTDRGERWVDVTRDLAAPPASVEVQRPAGQAAELWITDTAKQAYRVEPGGAVRAFDRLPHLPEPPLRPKDPAWHGREAPLVAAVRRGARLDGDRAVVAAGGDVVEVHLRTGAITIVAAGRLPPELPCEAVGAAGDVLFVCAGHGRPSVVMTAGTLDRPSRIERTFPNDGPFYAGDDGSLVYGGSCDGSRMSTAACARTLAGEWRDVSFDADGPDAGSPAPKAPPVASKPGAPPNPEPHRVLRWIPRPGGRPLAVVQDGAIPAVFDPQSGLLRSFKDHEDAWKRSGAVTAALATQPAGSSGSVVDRRWTATEAGALRGWIEHGQAALVTPDGNVALTAFHFARAAVRGPFGLAEDGDFRTFQSTNHGDTWIEVAGVPVAGTHGMSPTSCTDVGCELSPWVRLGWEATRAVPRPEPVRAPPAPALPRAALREIACTPLREERLVALSPTRQSPEDFGFGARRVPVAVESKKGPSGYVRRFHTRGVLNPPLASIDDERALRAMVHGYAAEFTAVPDAKSPLDGIVVRGPSASAESYRRDLAFVLPFDPGAAVFASSFDLAALLPFARAENTSLAQLFPGEGPDVDPMIPVLPIDPAAPSGLVFSITGDGVYLPGALHVDARGGKQVKRTLGAIVRDQATLTSAVELGPGDVAALAVASDGSEDVLRIAAGTSARMHHLPGPPDRLHVANPDALAVGPQGALAVIRTPSGREPPSKSDPALLIPFNGGVPTPLAPWSTLAAADDPACRNEPGGYRAIVASAGSWVRVRGATAVGPMSARVRWTANRVCLEAIEVPDDPRNVRSGDEVAVVVVARFTGTSAAARIGVAPGVELRQPLSCSLPSPAAIAGP